MSASTWTLLDLRKDLKELYQLANAEDAQEADSIRFVGAVLDAWISCTGKALVRTAEQPPTTEDHGEHRRRRVDIVVDGFDETNERRVRVLFVEAKGANARSNKYQEVENQAQNACEAHLSQLGRHHVLVYAVCVVGTAFRVFSYFTGREETWRPLFGGPEEYDHTQYVDASSTTSINIWHALMYIVHNPPKLLADMSYLEPNPPPASSQQTQAAQVSRSVTSQVSGQAGASRDRVPTAPNTIITPGRATSGPSSHTQPALTGSSYSSQAWNNFRVRQTRVQGEMELYAMVKHTTNAQGQWFLTKWPQGQSKPPMVWSSLAGGWLQTFLQSDGNLWFQANGSWCALGSA
ncbi:hypothetical protein LTR78_010647 [Recurvomyces mirabilis]|uniref:Uncharacterized protein n=1 Tax=Recurvomyces mirabilis TaxID=574656 RepID=A0AAE0TPD2_9PEZI|nr:hypothetical protein LTR78_010647 [Recurvomyces mirabilis]